MQWWAALTAAPGRRAERALAAAYAHLHAGAFETALGLVAEAEAAAGDDLQRARVEQLRGQVDRASNSGREAPVRLLRAAMKLKSLDARLARHRHRLQPWTIALTQDQRRCNRYDSLSRTTNRKQCYDKRH